MSHTRSPLPAQPGSALGCNAGIDLAAIKAMPSLLSNTGLFMPVYAPFSSCPEPFATRIIKPDELKTHEDRPARAQKIIGYLHGQPCFYFHTYSIIESRIDCDDFTYEIVTYFERAIAWRMHDDLWLQQKTAAHHPICRPSNQQVQDFEVVAHCAWLTT